MKKNVLIFLFILGLLSLSYACEPCFERFGFKETVLRSDAIIIGHKIEDGPTEGDIGGPGWIKIEVGQVLKGNIADKIITVNSWSGMCGYGIVLEDQNSYVMFLRGGHDQFDSVEQGCGVTIYPFIDERVDMDGEWIDLEEFKEKVNDVDDNVALGIDQDGDGIWDDIQDFLEENYEDEKDLYRFLVKYVAMLQEALVNAGDKQKSIEIANEMAGVTGCLYSVEGYDSRKIMDPIMAEFLNSMERTRAYLTYNGQLGGEVFPLLSDSDLVVFCESIK